MRNPIKSRWLAAGLLVMTLGLAACGSAPSGSSGDNSNQSTATTETTTVPIPAAIACSDIKLYEKRALDYLREAEAATTIDAVNYWTGLSTASSQLALLARRACETDGRYQR
jgi:hypothetical protein